MLLESHAARRPQRIPHHMTTMALLPLLSALSSSSPASPAGRSVRDAALAEACGETKAGTGASGCLLCCGHEQHALRSAGWTAEDCEAYCAAPAAASPLRQRRFGVNVHYGGGPGDRPAPGAVVMAEMCAAAQVTRNDAWWRSLERVKGVYNFTEMDAWVAAVRNATGSSCAAGPDEQMLMHFILEGGNHLWTGEDSGNPTTPAQVQAFTNFAVATITRYKGLGILWEVYNEADIRAWNVAEYAALFISVGKAVRADPAISGELLVGPSTSTVACEYVQAVKDLGALQYADAVSVHAYCAGAPEQMRWQFDAMRRVVGPGIALLSGEWGWATCTGAHGVPVNCLGGTQPDLVSEPDQAMYVARQWLVMALEKIPVSIVYDWTNDAHVIPGTPYDRTQWEQNAGLRMEGDGAPKLASHAAVAVQRFVGRRPLLAQLGDRTDMQYVLAFGATTAGPPPVASTGTVAHRSPHQSASATTAAEGAEVFAVWTLSAVGSMFHETGRGESAYCGGEALWTGVAADCYERCTQTEACRGFVTYPTGRVHADSNCQLTGSRCLVPRPVKGCGINITPASQTCARGPHPGNASSASR